ncbi:MAG: Endoribonuclease [Betaproteobacteria bacterium]|nr:Endoribonuclease [Betaproteobacteria bacterium]
MARTRKPSVKALQPVVIPQGNIRYAPGMRAGRWIFATGHKGVADYARGMAADVLQADAPHWASPKLRREAEQIFRNTAAVFKAGGGDLRNIVRVDQNYTSGHAVESYHDARRAMLKDHIPPSTSTLTQGFLLPGQEIEVHMIGIVPQNNFRPRHIRPPGQAVHATSGYSLALAAGDYVFVAGRMADSFTFGEGLAAEARMPQGHLWKGLPIKLEAEFIIREKIEPALKAAGSSLKNIVKCQVYLRDVEDFAPFNEVWSKFFPKAKPATTLIPAATPGFFLADARIEINTIALTDAGTTRKEIIDAGVVPAFKGYSQAVRAGDLLFISGLLPVDENGLAPSARIDPAQPYFGSSVQAQMQAMLVNAEKICRAAGTSLANVVRIQQYHTDLKDFYPAYRVWEQQLPGQYLPFSAVQVPFLPVPGCAVQLDLWVYAP